MKMSLNSRQVEAIRYAILAIKAERDCGIFRRKFDELWEVLPAQEQLDVGYLLYGMRIQDVSSEEILEHPDA